MMRIVTALLLCLPALARADSVVVFNEIMYHPATNEPALEWVEFYDQNAVDVDLSGWHLAGGIDYTFPEGTVIRGGGYLVVAIAPSALVANTGQTNILGPFSGRLSNSGERLELRDLNNRLMDSVTYGVDGTWPAGADGSGSSLAKRNPNLSSAPAANWTTSAESGGTPGAANFTSVLHLGAQRDLVPITASWRYDDSGADFGADWREPGFDDSGWSSGSALFFYGTAVLPGPRNTALTPGRNTCYFRSTFTLNGDPELNLLSFRSIIDDGAVFYLNGVEVYRSNMPTGAVTYATMAASSIGSASYNGPFNISASNLVAGQNVLAVELHQTTLATNAGLRVASPSALTARWDGKEGEFATFDSPAPAPTNAAAAAVGAEVFTSSNTNLAFKLNDGLYGSANSWSPAANDLNPFLVVRFNQTITLSSFAFSRDNGDTNEAACGGTCTDRAVGNYIFQYTLVTNPPAVLASSTNPSNGWTSFATVQYLSAQPGFSPHLRHRFEIAATNGDPIFATGLRVRFGATNTMDEIEVNPPAFPGFDAAFAMQLISTEILPPPPKLAFNEISSPGSFSLELINYGNWLADLDGVQIRRGGANDSPSYVFPSQMLPPGGMVFLTQAQLGFGAAVGDKLFLYTPNRSALLDAVTVQSVPRARFPDATGDWRYPASPTPGASNAFVFHDEIVFNEIMYHHPPSDPIPAVTSNTTLLPITGVWRFNDSGLDLGADWRAPGYDDAAWPSGPALFYFNPGSLSAPTNTPLAPGRSTYYFRTVFNFSGATNNLTLSLRPIVDDGAVFYLNGTEVYRLNMPLGPVTYTTPAAIAIGDAAFILPVNLALGNLQQGPNVLAVEVHQAASLTNGSGFTLSGGGLRLVEEGPVGASSPMNLARRAGAAPFVIDSLAGFPIHDYLHLTDGVYGNPNSWIGNSGSPGFAGVRFGGLFTISGFAFGRDNTGTYSDRTLGLYALQFTRVATPGVSTAFTANADTGWANIGTLNYLGAGSGLFAHPSRRHRYSFDPVQATGLRLVVPGTGLANGTCIDELEVNPPDTLGDIAFGAELTVTATLTPAVPFTRSTEEWLELHNRSSNSVDLTAWQIDGGLRYAFAAGTMIPPQGYLVVANDAAALRAKWPEVAGAIVGNFSGKLGADDIVNLKDPTGNPANTIRIYAGGWSDGGGSSLELTDSRADNSRPEVWTDSDETTRGFWQTVSYRMVSGQNFGNTLWNEFRLGLLEAGDVLVDDVSVIRDPDGARQQLIQNGNFETTTGNTHWRMLGDHAGSQIILDPDNPANHVLRMSASAPLRTSHNHVESSFLANTPLVDGQQYEVSYRARWLAGSPQVCSSAYFQRLAKTTILSIPPRHGTPGAPNSRRIDNAGPTFAELTHTPIIPQANEAVTVTVRASDPDGVASATLSYRVNPALAFTNVQMTLRSDGRWAASIPAQAAGKITQFYVTAQDTLGAAAFAPAQGPFSRALYQVADTQGTKLPAHELRLIQLDADRDSVLNATNVMSQAFIGGTLIYDRAEVFYDAGVRLHGSAAGRARDGDDYISYTISFPPTHLFRGLQGEVNIDRSGRSPVARQQDEIYILHMFHRAGLPCHYSDLCYFIAPKTLHTGTAILQLAAYGRGFVQEQYNAIGSVFNYDFTYEPSVTLNGNFESVKLPVPLQTQLASDFADLSPDKEQYRWPYDMRSGTREDDFSGILRLCQTLALPQAQMESRIPAMLNVDEVLQITALTILCGIGDIYFSPLPSATHNLRIFTPAAGGPAEFLPWDMDFVFSVPSSSSIYLDPSFTLSKLLNNSNTRRIYVRHVSDLCQTVFNTAYMNPWLAHYGSVVGQNYTGGASYIQSRRATALSQVPARQPFAITSNGGKDFLTNTPMVTITGSGWLDIEAIWLSGGSPPIVTWPTLTNWQATVPLMLGTNLLTFRAYDRTNNLLGTKSITVTTSATGGGVDTDGDGLPDVWELNNRLDPFVDDANLDPDGDGLTNLQEYLAGTDPNDPHSFLRIDAATDSSTVRLTFFAAAGRSYSVLYRDDPQTGAWLNLKTTPAQTTNRVVDLLVPQPLAPQRYYRLFLPRQP